MSRYPYQSTLVKRIFKIQSKSLEILHHIQELNRGVYPFTSLKLSTAQRFNSALIEFQDIEISPHEWVALIKDPNRKKELKEKMIFDSITGLEEFEELITDHSFFLESEFFDEVAWSEGDGNTNPPQIERLSILNNLIFYRKYIDEDRWSLIKRYNAIFDDYDWERFYYRGCAGISLAELDTKLWLTFEKIIQSIPTPGGATPLRNDYARSEHFAHNISVESCRKLFSSEYPNSPHQFVISSSFMSALHSLLLSLLSLRTNNKPIRIGLFGDQIYFEVQRLFGIVGNKEIKDTILGENFTIDHVNGEMNHLNFDVIYFEAVSNSRNGLSVDWEEVLNIAQRSNCQYVISDTTSNPFAFTESYINRFDGIFVQLQSLAKYVQLGTNVSMGGLAIIHEKDTGKTCKKIAKKMRETIKFLGQHPDPNIAKAICRNQEILKKRLAKMNRNAHIFKKLLLEFCDSSKNWVVTNNGFNPTNIIWIEVKKEWIIRAKEITPKGSKFGLSRLNFKEPIDHIFIKYILEFYLWQPTLGEWDDCSPLVKTSFGFNQTTFHIMNNRNRKTYIRISCGIESIELIREIAFNTLKTLGCESNF